MLTVTEENILVDLEANNKEEIIRILVDLLVKNGCIKPEYYDVLLEREERYPTGLPTENVKVAIPHGFSDENVLKPSIAIGILKHQVVFRNMFNYDEELDVGIVFLLALSSKDKKTSGEDLSRVMGVFSDSTLLSRLQGAKTPTDVTEIMSTLLA